MIPGYVYGECEENGTLRQGDIILLKGEIRKVVKKFFPGIIKPHEKRYLMVLSQTCDLYRDDNRKCKIEHINLCVLSKFERYLRRMLTGSSEINSNEIITEEDYENNSIKLHKLISNSDPKNYIFLPRDEFLETDMVAVLSVNYPIQIQHYDSLLENRVAALSDVFRGKLGYVLGKLFSRIATEDLSGKEYVVTEFINESLERIKVFRAPDQSVKSEVIRRMNGDLDINELVLKVCQERINKKLSNKKNILVSYLNKLIFTNYSEVTNLFEGLESCEGSEFRKKLRALLNESITDDEISNLFGMDD